GIPADPRHEAEEVIVQQVNLRETWPPSAAPVTFRTPEDVVRDALANVALPPAPPEPTSSDKASAAHRAAQAAYVEQANLLNNLERDFRFSETELQNPASAPE